MNTAKKLLVLTALVLAACTADDDASSGITIRGRLAGNDNCEFDPGDPYRLGQGVLDVGPQYQALVGSGALQFGLVVAIRNDMTLPTANSSAASPSGKTWWAQTARVEASTSIPNGSGVRRYAVPSHAVEPAAGEVAQDILVIDSGLAATLAAGLAPGEVQLVQLAVTLEGVTGDGFDLDSNEWSFPVRVCNGCLPIPTCPAGEVVVFNTCFFPGQDGAAVCVAP